MKQLSQIEWFNVTDCVPLPWKEVLASNGTVVFPSHVVSIDMWPDNQGCNVSWKGGVGVTKWAFMPKAPETATASAEISVW